MSFKSKRKNYKKLLDSEVWQFIDKSESFFSEDNDKPKSISEIRTCYNDLCKYFSTPHPKNVCFEDKYINTVPVRHYKIKNVSNSREYIIYFHGGGFDLGDLESHDDICAELCAKTNIELFSIDYKLCPEYTPKESFEDGVKCVSWIDKKINKPMILAGDSAGGWIAANIVHKMRYELNNIIGQLLIYPLLGGDLNKGSFVTHSKAPLLSTEWIISNQKKYFDNNNIKINQFSPLKDNNFSLLPPTVIFTAECDPLSDDGIIYAKKLTSNNSKAVCLVEKGLVHSYLRARHSSKIAKKSFKKIIAAFKNLANQKWPYIK